MISANSQLHSIDRTRESMEERQQYVCLDRNERTEIFSDADVQAMFRDLKASELCHYPDPSALYQRLSVRLHISEEHLYITPGSDAAVRMILQTYLRPGDSVLMADPSYAMYPIYTKIFQAIPCQLAYNAELQLDITELKNRLKDRPRVLVLANPDQPTGAILSIDTLTEVAQACHAADVLMVIDEAYYPFYQSTALDLIHRFDNIVILRTFSKAAGLAGLRLGFLAAHPEIVRNVIKVKGAHEVNAMAIRCGSYLLDHPELVDRFLIQIEAGRDVLRQVALRFGLGFPDCQGNFQLLRLVGVPSRELIVGKLKSRGYLVKGSFESPSLKDSIRVTLAGPAIMKEFALALASVIEESKVEESRL
jgi:histidinol-phosphate aminotransferase